MTNIPKGVKKMHPCLPLQDLRDEFIRDFCAVEKLRIKSEVRERLDLLLNLEYERGAKDECKRWVDQPANQHDERIRQELREEMKKMVKSVHVRINGEANPEAVEIYEYIIEKTKEAILAGLEKADNEKEGVK